MAVHQEIQLLRYRTVAENIHLGREPRRWGLIDWTRMRRDTELLLSGLGLEIDPDATLGVLSTAQQQMVAIARGLSIGATVLILDEPTSSLAEREVAILYDLMRRLRAGGTAIVYISHRFDELYAVCDRVTVLRDGVRVATASLAELDRPDLVCLMLGKSRDALRQGTTAFLTPPDADGTCSGGTAPPCGEAATRAEAAQRLAGVRTGEIVGLAGLLGSGRTETARALSGVDPADTGAVYLRERRLDPRTPDQAIEAGIAFLSEDRKAEGIIPELSVRENLTLAALPHVDPVRHRLARPPGGNRGPVHGAPRDQGNRPGSEDPGALGRESAKGAARPPALHVSRAADTRRAHARDRHRREGRDPDADR